jgi:hypothetical protein
VVATLSKFNHTPALLASLPFLIVSELVKIALFSIALIRREVLIFLTRSVPMPRNSCPLRLSNLHKGNKLDLLQEPLPQSEASPE